MLIETSIFDHVRADCPHEHAKQQPELSATTTPQRDANRPLKASEWHEPLT